jgi:hypothetical protein
MPDSIGFVAGEDEVGRTPPTADQLPRALTQAQLRTPHGPGERPGGAADQAAGPSPNAAERFAGQPPATAEQPAQREQPAQTEQPAPGEQPARAEQPAATTTAEQPPQGEEPAQQEQPAPGEQLARAVQPATTTAEQPAQPAAPQPATPTDEQPAQVEEKPGASTPGFGERGRMRRRARFLRKARELAYRDLGGLVYDLHRFGQRNDPVVLAKLATLGHIDAELRALEQALHEIRPVTVLREVGIAACPRCAAIHGNQDRFCPGCGLAFAAGAERPLSTAPVTAQASPGVAGTPSSLAPTGPASPAPLSPRLAGPAPSTPAPSGSAADPPTTIERPPAPALKPPATPVAATPQPPAPGDRDGKREDEDEPTRILRPPAGGP